MIYNQELKYEKINIHKKLDHLNGYTFVPLKYDNNDFVIQTPKLFIPFNISKDETTEIPSLIYMFEVVAA